MLSLSCCCFLFSEDFFALSPPSSKLLAHLTLYKLEAVSSESLCILLKALEKTSAVPFSFDLLLCVF